jgi:NAD(P)-dependent dehydrogenase (short-subunit alcohol dehydrogenase family)
VRDYDGLKDALDDGVAQLGRLDIVSANAVLFLASDEARYVTGVTLPVDAGAVIK